MFRLRCCVSPKYVPAYLLTFNLLGLDLFNTVLSFCFYMVYLFSFFLYPRINKYVIEQIKSNRRHRYKVSVNHDETLADKVDNPALQSVYVRKSKESHPLRLSQVSDFEAIMLGSTNSPSLDPFKEVEPLAAECTLIDVPHAESTSEYKNQHEILGSDNFSNEWKISDGDIDDRNTFDMFDV